MKTKAAVLYEKNSPFKIEELDLQGPGEGQVLVELKATGICRTDEHALMGATVTPFPTVLGHEGGGIVREVGPGVTSIKEGDHVVTVWMPSCGRCEPCRKGLGHLCVRGADLFSGRMLDGKTLFKRNGQDVHHFMFLSAFSEFVVVEEDAAVVVDREARLDRVCLLGCALTTGFGAVTRTANFEAGSNAVIFGFGGIGSGVLNGLVQSGANMIIVVEPKEWKEEVATKMGATHFINPDKEDPVQKVLELTHGVGAGYAFECWGHEEVQAQCYNAIRNKGKAVFIGAVDEAVNSIPINNFSIINTEKIIMGSLYGSCVPMLEIPKYVSLYMRGKFDLDSVVTKTFPLEDINKGFEALRNGDVVRGVIKFD